MNRWPDGQPTLRSYLALVSAVGLGFSLSVLPNSADALTLRWFGHAFFLVTSSDGVRVAMDPFGDIGYPMPELGADVVTVSHEHGDHNAPDRLAGSPAILRGLEAGGADWNSVVGCNNGLGCNSNSAVH